MHPVLESLLVLSHNNLNDLVFHLLIHIFLLENKIRKPGPYQASTEAGLEPIHAISVPSL